MSEVMTKTVEAHRKERVGEVISDKMDKTLVVWVERRFRHPKYEKELTVGHKYYAHDEKEEAGVGDKVRIVETRPLSRLKRWRLIEVVSKARIFTPPASVGEAAIVGVAKKGESADVPSAPKAEEKKPAAGKPTRPRKK